jgi:hypothetical protein
MDRQRMRMVTRGNVGFAGVALATFAALAACSVGCSSSDDTGFTPEDSGARDAAIDSKGSDAGRDTSVGTPDGGEDTSAPPVDASADSAADASIDAPTDSSTLDSSTDASIDAPVDSGPDASSGGDGGAGVSLIGKWTFDEGTGTTSADLSGHGHAATLKGGASWTVSGKTGSGLALDGATGYADVGMTLIDTTKSFTVACWMKLNVVNNWEVALSEDSVTGSLFGLKLRGDGTNQYDFDFETSDVMSPGFVVAQSTTHAPAAAWTHLAGVYDRSASGAAGGAIRIYVNGVLETTTGAGQAPLVATGHFLIGRGLYNAAVGSFVNGVIDDVVVYDGALGDADIAALYGAQGADAGADASSPDASSTDASSTDASSTDASSTDASSPDASSTDATVTDATPD